MTMRPPTTSAVVDPPYTPCGPVVLRPLSSSHSGQSFGGSGNSGPGFQPFGGSHPSWTSGQLGGGLKRANPTALLEAEHH